MSLYTVMLLVGLKMKLMSFIEDTRNKFKKKNNNSELLTLGYIRCLCSLKAGIKIVGEPGGQLSLSHWRMFIKTSFMIAKQLDCTAPC